MLSTALVAKQISDKDWLRSEAVSAAKHFAASNKKLDEFVRKLLSMRPTVVCDSITYNDEELSDKGKLTELFKKIGKYEATFYYIERHGK